MQSFLKQPNSFSQNAKISAKSFLSSGKKLGSNLMGSSPVKVAKKLAPPTKQLAKSGFDVTKNMLMGIFDSIKSLRKELNQVKIKQVTDKGKKRAAADRGKQREVLNKIKERKADREKQREILNRIRKRKENNEKYAPLSQRIKNAKFSNLTKVSDDGKTGATAVQQAAGNVIKGVGNIAKAGAKIVRKGIKATTAVKMFADRRKLRTGLGGSKNKLGRTVDKSVSKVKTSAGNLINKIKLGKIGNIIGAKGAKGNTGDAGAMGARGNTGAAGAKGELGKLARKDPLLKKRLIQERMLPMGGKPSKDKSTLSGVTVDIAKTLLPSSKETAKRRRQNDSSQFVKNYLDFFGSKKTAKILRENLKITRNSLVDMFETTSLLKMQANNIANNLKTKDNKKGGGGLLGGLLGGLGKLSGFMKFLPTLLPLIPLAIPFLKILAVGGMIALLIKFKDPIFKFIADSAGKIVGFLKDGILNIAKGIFNFFGKKPKEGAEGRTRRRSRRSDDEDTSVENERITEFDKKVNELQNKKKYGGTGRPITINDKTYNPGDEGYKEAIASVRQAMKSNKQPGEVKEVSESKVEGAKEGTSGNVKADTGKNMDIVKNIEKQAIEESQDPQFEVVPFSTSGSNNQPQTMGGSSSPSSSGGGGSPTVSFFPSKNFDTISDQTAKSLMNIVDG